MLYTRVKHTYSLYTCCIANYCEIFLGVLCALVTWHPSPAISNMRLAGLMHFVIAVISSQPTLRRSRDLFLALSLESSTNLPILVYCWSAHAPNDSRHSRTLVGRGTVTRRMTRPLPPPAPAPPAPPPPPPPPWCFPTYSTYGNSLVAELELGGRVVAVAFYGYPQIFCMAEFT